MSRRASTASIRQGSLPRKTLATSAASSRRKWRRCSAARLIRAILSRKSSLFGLGIPPAQYDSLITSGDGTMASVLSARLEKLACHFPLRSNYFAWQAFARRYPAPGEAALPAYLEKANYETLKANIDRVAVHHINYHRSARGQAGRHPSTASCFSTRRTG